MVYAFAEESNQLPILCSSIKYLELLQIYVKVEHRGQFSKKIER